MRHACPPTQQQSNHPLLLSAAALLAGTAVGNYYAAHRAQDRHPPTGYALKVNGIQLRFLQDGEGDSVLLLHGNGSMSDEFRASGLLSQLAHRYHVIAFDRPGFGYSDRPRGTIWSPDVQAELFEAALDRLGIERPIIVAHSWATLVAIAMALRSPARVRGLVLCSGYYYPSPRLDVLTNAPPAIPLLGDVLRYTISPLLGRLTVPRHIRQLFSPQEVPASFENALPLELLLRPGQLRATAADSALQIPAANELSRHYGHIRPPVTILAGEDDPIVSTEDHSALLHRALPDSRSIAYPGFGHMLHYLHPEEVVTAVDEVLGRAPNTPPAAVRELPIPAV